MTRSDAVDLSDPAQVDRYLSARVRAEGECWVWGRAFNNQGYGQMQTAAFRGLAHRFSYEYHRAPIPDGLHIDHLCSERRCVNPWHLEPVTQAENNRRARAKKSTCVRGHPYATDSAINRDGKRYCRTCNRNRMRRARAIG